MRVVSELQGALRHADLHNIHEVWDGKPAFCKHDSMGSWLLIILKYAQYGAII